jgi:hypothetical protein
LPEPSEGRARELGAQDDEHSSVGSPASERLERQARNETFFRVVNELTADANDARGRVDRLYDEYACECSNRGCRDPIRLTRKEYEAVRSVPTWFAIALHHENPEIDRVLGENERFATVEKLPGAGERIARATDPRY